jgi:hypothetical protein
MWSRRNVGWANAALLFGVCGAASSQLFELGRESYLVPIPFAVVTALLCVRRVVPGIVLVILDFAIWQLAYRTAIDLATDGPTAPRVGGICFAGLVGGLEVSLAVGLCKLGVPAVRTVALSALAGAVCGLPFAWWVIFSVQAPHELSFSVTCFAIWQAAVGVCLWHGYRLGKPDRET